jgi:hypothetical protein
MSNPAKKRKHKIVDYGHGPHLYAGKVLNSFFDGSAVTVVLGNLEARVPEEDAAPVSPPVIAVCGKVTLSPAAAVDLFNMLNQMLGVLQGQNQNAPSSPKVN